MTHEQRHYQAKAGSLTSEQLAAAILRWRVQIQNSHHGANIKRLEGLIHVYETELLARNPNRTTGTQPPTPPTTE